MPPQTADPQQDEIQTADPVQGMLQVKGTRTGTLAKTLNR